MGRGVILQKSARTGDLRRTLFCISRFRTAHPPAISRWRQAQPPVDPPLSPLLRAIFLRTPVRWFCRGGADDILVSTTLLEPRVCSRRRNAKLKEHPAADEHLLLSGVRIRPPKVHGCARMNKKYEHYVTTIFSPSSVLLVPCFIAL